MDGVTDLAVRAAAGDRAALSGLVQRTQADVWRMCAHLVDAQGADDLTQETFLRLVGALPSFRAEASGRTFVLSIARRTCMDELRRRTRRRALTGRLLERAGHPVTEPDPAGLVALDDLVAQLDVDRREAFVCTQVLGLGYAEAAEVCGCPVGTIRSRVARAREDLVGAMGGERGAARRGPEAAEGGSGA